MPLPKSVTRIFMKALIFSDSHGNYRYMQKIIGDCPDVEYVFFLGDGLSDLEQVQSKHPDKIYYGVRGNCDFFSSSLLGSYEIDRMLWLEGKRIWLTHGHAHNVKYGEQNIYYKARENGIDIVLYGHTHIPSEHYYPDGDGGVYTFCPGSIGQLAHSDCYSFGRLQIDEKGILFSHGSIRYGTL